MKENKRYSPSFGEFLSDFPDSLLFRAFEYLFLSSNKITNLNSYIFLKKNIIDFFPSRRRKIEKKISDLNYPLSRTVKKTFFNNQKIYLMDGVFIPRTETEGLINITINWIKDKNFSNFSYIDLCCGSGNISISIVKKLREKIKKYAALDSSFFACLNTLKNFELIGEKRAKVYLSNWVKFLNIFNDWEVITLNPPYLAEEELKSINENNSLQKYDPKRALQGGNSGWSHYSKLIEFAIKNKNWKIISLECSEFHEDLWNKERKKLNKFDIKVFKYKDYLEKFRFIVLSRD